MPPEWRTPAALDGVQVKEVAALYAKEVLTALNSARALLDVGFPSTLTATGVSFHSPRKMAPCPPRATYSARRSAAVWRDATPMHFAATLTQHLERTLWESRGVGTWTGSSFAGHGHVGRSWGSVSHFHPA